jgi:uncharacterized tellurite resistance protein B-like protein
MLQMLKNLLGAVPAIAGHDVLVDEKQLAAIVLLVEVAKIDTSFDEGERARIHTFACDQFGLSAADADSLISVAEAAVDKSTHLYEFTKTIRKGFSYEDRVALMETLCHVVYADGVADPFENQLLRRIGGLIYVTDRDRGHASKKARESAIGSRKP